MYIFVGEIPAHLNTIKKYLLKHEPVSELLSFIKYKEITNTNVNFAGLNKELVSNLSSESE